MTEKEWLACDDPGQMLSALWKAMSKVKRFRRKIRLLMAAGCRQAWHRFGHVKSRELIEASEDYAEGSLGYSAFRANWNEVFNGQHRGVEGAHLACMTTHYQIWEAALGMSQLADKESAKLLEQVHLIRDVFGPLLFQQVSAATSIRTRDVCAIAQAAYDNRSLPSGHLEPDRLAVLADALEDAGCDNDDILSHLRSPGPHVRGCWALDLVLAKE